MGRVTILYFAWLRERVGCAREVVDLPDGVGDIAGLIAMLRTQSAGHEAVFSLGRVVRAAVNQDFALPDTRVSPGDEVAFFPPVTGG